MITTNNSPFAGLAKVILVLVFIGVLVGLAFSGTDLTNFITNTARAQGITRQNEVQAAKDIIDIQNYRTIQDATTQAQKDKILADRVTYQESLNQGLQLQARKAALELETARLVSYFLIAVGVFIAFCIGIFMIQFGFSRLIVARAQAEKISSWQDHIQRKEQIRIARQRELMIRADRIRGASKLNVPPFYTNEEAPIPWEDLQKQYTKTRRNEY
jgi:hypothetical protein